MTSLVLSRLGLAQYIETFESEGFENWDTVLDITESDLDALGVKLGHRRILQREIRTARGQSVDQISSPHSSTRSRPFLDSQNDHEDGFRDGRTVNEPRVKRKYRRHPKPDKNAPDRPPSAYVIFSNRIRDELKPLNLSFTEIAKRVGESWQVLASIDKEPFETRAANAKAAYNAEMANYKLTTMYSEYVEYIAKFKAKNALEKDDKRPKLGSDGGFLKHPSNTASGPDGSDFLIDHSKPNHRRLDSVSSSGRFSAISEPTSPVNITSRPTESRGRPRSVLPNGYASPFSTLPSSPSMQSNPSAGPSLLSRNRSPNETYAEQSTAFGAYSNSFRDLRRGKSESASSRSGSSDVKIVDPSYSKAHFNPVEFQPMTASGRIPICTDYNAWDSSKSLTSSNNSRASTIASSTYGSRNCQDDQVSYIQLPPLSAVGLKPYGRNSLFEQSPQSTEKLNSKSVAMPLDLQAPSQSLFDLNTNPDVSRERPSFSGITLQQNRIQHSPPGNHATQATPSRPVLSNIHHKPRDAVAEHHQRSDTDPLSVLAEAAGAEGGSR